MKKLNDLTKYKGTLPYASEMFGVYSPLLGWKSERKNQRMRQAFQLGKRQFLSSLATKYKPQISVSFNEDTVEPKNIALATLMQSKLAIQQESYLLGRIAEKLEGRSDRPTGDEWKKYLKKDVLENMLFKTDDHNTIFGYYQDIHKQNIEVIKNRLKRNDEDADTFIKLKETLTTSQNADTLNNLRKESAIAGLLADLATNDMKEQLEQIFYEDSTVDINAEIKKLNALLSDEHDDPFLTFDPKSDIKNVSLSPIGIVHLYRQFFFELDTFLGSPEAHIWLSPKCTAELVETSSKKTTIEKIYESSWESNNKTETSSTEQSDLNTAVNKENKENTKTGFSTTVTGSYPTVNIAATASLNIDNSQQESNITANKTMNQQTSKLSTEIRQNYKSTFKTITEITDESSKRYVLTNPSDEKLINYEMRRKMRQVAIQVQDMGTYLCWETFVDEPGKNLGLANLVNLATPADLVTPPDQTAIPLPPENKFLVFTDKYLWVGGDKAVLYDKDERMIWGESKKIELPEGYELNDQVTKIEYPYWYDGVDPVDKTRWRFKFMVNRDRQTYRIGLWVNDSYQPKKGDIFNQRLEGLNINERHEFSISFGIGFKLTIGKRQEIEAANSKKIKEAKAADLENIRLTKNAFIKAAKERIKLASKIKKRPFEDLREEERTIVYRNLIQSLMTTTNYNLPESQENFQIRHVFSELINSIFDIDKMLYFVAPEWWKPRKHYHQAYNAQDSDNEMKKTQSNQSSIQAVFSPFKPANNVPRDLKDSIVTWSDGEYREDNYFITEDAEPAQYGSSLGWLLQLDGDKLRNAFLNSPWVKAVIPIRPGKEQEAINWLQNANVEGVAGLNAEYAVKKEHTSIIKKLANEIPQANNPPTVGDAIRVLCMDVAEKNAASLKVGDFPKDPEIHDDEKVSTTPIEKVFEHGFYPLQGGFRANPDPDDPNDPNPDPNNKDKYFNIFTQWLEILPTDQIVPVPVEYDPVSGRMLGRDH